MAMGAALLWRPWSYEPCSARGRTCAAGKGDVAYGKCESLRLGLFYHPHYLHEPEPHAATRWEAAETCP